tara:strand:+ start:20743 stop:21681 length:939 start_codon:yes stop_codon:yes gene_type:complete
MKFSNIKLWTSQRNNTCKALRFFSSNISQSIFYSKLSRFINKYLYKFGLGSSLNRYNNSLTIYSAQSDKNLYKAFKKSDKFINFGSGAFFHNRWKNYDYPGQSKYYKSIQGLEGQDFFPIDLCSNNLSIPEDDVSIELIYCSHTLEHIDYSSSIRFLKECFRILKKGGVMRIALPNTKNDFYLLRCLISQSLAIEDIKENYLRDVVSHILADTQKLNIKEIHELLAFTGQNSAQFFYEVTKKYSDFAKFNKSNPERHINYWDFENLISTTSNIGFSSCIPCYQGSSVALPLTNLHVFDNTEPQISIYADIIK